MRESLELAAAAATEARRSRQGTSAGTGTCDMCAAGVVAATARHRKSDSSRSSTCLLAHTLIDPWQEEKCSPLQQLYFTLYTLHGPFTSYR